MHKTFLAAVVLFFFALFVAPTVFAQGMGAGPSEYVVVTSDAFNLVVDDTDGTTDYSENGTDGVVRVRLYYNYDNKTNLSIVSFFVNFSGGNVNFSSIIAVGDGDKVYANVPPGVALNSFIVSNSQLHIPRNVNDNYIVICEGVSSIDHVYEGCAGLNETVNEFHFEPSNPPTGYTYDATVDKYGRSYHSVFNFTGGFGGLAYQKELGGGSGPSVTPSGGGTTTIGGGTGSTGGSATFVSSTNSAYSISVNENTYDIIISEIFLDNSGVLFEITDGSSSKFFTILVDDDEDDTDEGSDDEGDEDEDTDDGDPVDTDNDGEADILVKVVWADYPTAEFIVSQYQSVAAFGEGDIVEETTFVEPTFFSEGGGTWSVLFDFNTASKEELLSWFLFSLLVLLFILLIALRVVGTIWKGV